MAVLRLAKPIDFCIDFFSISQKEKKNVLHSIQDLWAVFSIRAENKLCAYLTWVAVVVAAVVVVVVTGKYRMEGGEA